MSIQTRPASEIMRDTFRYYEGSRVLRELGFEGAGDNWWTPRYGKPGEASGPMSFEAALRTPKVHARLQHLYWRQTKKAMERMALAMAEQLRPAMEAMRKAAQTEPGVSEPRPCSRRSRPEKPALAGVRMNTGVIIWLVLCIGLSLLSASGPHMQDQPNRKLIQSFGFGAVLFSAGLALWWTAGMAVSALN